MAALWLKMIGTSENPFPDKPYHLTYVGFRSRRPSGIHRGDHLVLYAVGGSKRIFGLAEVTSEWYESEEGKRLGWPYRIDIALELTMNPSAGVDLVEVSQVINVARRSHLRLSREEYERASAKLREVSAER